MTASQTGSNGFTLRHGSLTDRGLRRALNEDALLALDPVFAVADGMGGHEAGEVASAVCIKTLTAAVFEARGTGIPLDPEALQKLMHSADAAIREAAQSRAGTTLSGAALVHEQGVPYWLVFNVGDSRTYLLHQGELSQVSIDHSEVQEMVDRGQITAEQAIVHPRRNIITRALGTGEDNAADFWLVPVNAGDRMLICSDGLTGEVRDEHLAEVLRRIEDPQAAAQELVEAALRSGGRDNITVVLVDVLAEEPQDGVEDTFPHHLNTTGRPRLTTEGAAA